MINTLKLTVLLTILGFNLSSLGATVQKVNPLLACLGQEELKIHRAKTTGPVYYLNQLFISELAALYGLTLKEKHFDRVCRNNKYSPSVNLLRELLLHGEDAFRIPKETRYGGVDALAVSSLASFIDQIPHVFFDYLSKLQSLAPTAPCLEKEIPEIGYYIDRFKYLETEISQEQLLANKERIKSIFRKLRGFDRILKTCEKRKKEEIR